VCAASRRSFPGDGADVDVPVALACRQTFVLKPSERRPSPATAWRIAARSRLPPACSRRHGDKARSTHCWHTPMSTDQLCRLDAIAEYIYATAAQNGKRVQALGGAKNHMVVMPDADLARRPTR